LKVANAAPIFEAATAGGGKTLLEVDNFAYAASLIPDEDEMKTYPVRYGRLSDPDGYIIEVREDPRAKPASRKLFKLTLNVLDIEESVAFYRDILGMNVLRRRSNVFAVPRHASMCAFMVSRHENALQGAFLPCIWAVSNLAAAFNGNMTHVINCFPSLSSVAPI
jgi:Glyoxalase/Bleomycin resistance protein/Dioxygenase superfamily